MTVIVDARGLACPGPVLETRKALSNQAVTSVSVLVDNEAAVENVGRMARSQGCEVRLENDTKNEFKLTLTRGDVPSEPQAESATDTTEAYCHPASNVVVLISADTIGRGDDNLGRLLMIAFIKTLKELVPRPTTILFMNSGVKLAVKGSELVSTLKDLEDLKMEILVCGTCLDFFNIKDSLAVGKISNMFEIGSCMTTADRLLRP